MKVSHSDDKNKTTLGQKAKVLVDSKATVNQIADRAYHAWLNRGCTHGFDVEDWLDAERQLLNQEVLLAEDS